MKTSVPSRLRPTSTPGTASGGDSSKIGCHLGVGRLDNGRYYACYSSDWPEGIVRRKRDGGTYEILFRCEDDFGPPALAVVITEEEAKELVREHKEETYEEMFGERL